MGRGVVPGRVTSSRAAHCQGKQQSADRTRRPLSVGRLGGSRDLVGEPSRVSAPGKAPEHHARDHLDIGPIAPIHDRATQ
jgi:hypothetical protein